ncbi:MAG: molybdenum cofactor guanylyltransferase [Devosia sp.]|uniref:molybdenum cofactor guanylyltransferase n=1 Tax=Devosia sp. TaxID=1871048 RepID=UPI0033927DDC
MNNTFGLILAGGEGSRLGGVRKADLRIGGVRLVQRVTSAFEGKVTEVFLASGQGAGSELRLPSIRDESPMPMGPLAGIRAMVLHLESRIGHDDVLVTAAVDTPFLPQNYVERLRPAALESGAAYAAWGDSIYPTNSAWRLTMLRDALEETSESAGPKAILRTLGAAPVDWSADMAGNPFANINTLADLIALQRRATDLGI